MLARGLWYTGSVSSQGLPGAVAGRGRRIGARHRPWAALLLATACLGEAGCHTIFRFAASSADGAPPGQEAGPQSDGGAGSDAVADGGGEARPTDAHATDVLPPDASSPLCRRCELAASTGWQLKCTGPDATRITLGPIGAIGSQQLLELHLGRASCNRVEVDLELCDPAGEMVLNLGDSPGNDGFGGDDGRRSNDSELELRCNSGPSSCVMAIYGNDYATGGSPSPLVPPLSGFVSLAGCGKYRLQVRHNRIEALRLVGGVASSLKAVAPAPLPGARPCSIFCLFQEDEEAGAADPGALAGDGDLYLGLNRAVSLVNASRVGAGVTGAVVTIY
ncbi:MAG: hypothetical protein IT371_14605 [Deltaproteobacteria bacterium]|nr:hypothetical protein [Deltaproteobacteria bacterium]